MIGFGTKRFSPFEKSTALFGVFVLGIILPVCSILCGESEAGQSRLPDVEVADHHEDSQSSEQSEHHSDKNCCASIDAFIASSHAISTQLPTPAAHFAFQPGTSHYLNNASFVHVALKESHAPPGGVPLFVQHVSFLI